MERVVRRQGIPQPFGVDDLHVPDLVDVDRVLEFAETGSEEGVGVRVLAVGSGRIGPFATGDVEGVEAHAEVGAVDGGHDGPGGFPRVDVGAPAEILVGEFDGWVLLEAEIGDVAEVGNDGFAVGGDLVGGQEVGGDLDDVCSEGEGQAEPEV